MSSMKGLGRSECERLRPITLAEVKEIDKEVLGKDFWRAVVLGVGLSGVIIGGLTYFWRM